MIIEPYLNFDGRCDEAINFYKQAVGAKVQMLKRFKDNPEPMPGAEAIGEKVMHASLKIGESRVMASDGRCQGKKEFHGIALSLSVATDDEAKRVFNALAEGGRIDMPLTRTFFSSSFGMLQDKFGVGWMVLVGA